MAAGSNCSIITLVRCWSPRLSLYRYSVATRSLTMRRLFVASIKKQQPFSRVLSPRSTLLKVHHQRLVASPFTTALGESNNNSELHKRTEAFLKDHSTVSTTSSSIENETIRLLKEWLNAPTNGSTSGEESASNMMAAIYNKWLRQSSYPQTTEPFVIMIQKYQQDKNGSAAYRILVDEWQSKLGGDLSLAPPLSAYHNVFKAYGFHHQQQQQLLRMEQVEQVRHLFQLLEQAHWEGQHSMAPTVETYSHLFHAMNYGHYNNNEIMNHNHNPKDTVLYDSDRVDSLQYVYEHYLKQQQIQQQSDSSNHYYYMIRAYSSLLVWGMRTKQVDFPNWFHYFSQNMMQSPECVQQARQHDNAQADESVSFFIARAYHAGLQYLVTLSLETPTITNGQAAIQMLIDSKRHGVVPTPPSHFELAIQTWAHLGLLKKDKDVVVKALESLLIQYEEEYLFANDTTTRPVHLSIYRTVIRILGHAKETIKADSLLHHVLKLQRKTGAAGPVEDAQRNMQIMWNSVMEAHFHSGNYERPYQLWEQMEQNTDGVFMNGISYSVALKSISRIRNAQTATQRAMYVWDTLQADEHVKPEATHYGSLISTFARHSTAQSYPYLMNILTTLEEEYDKLPEGSPARDRMKPEQAHYTAAIKSLSKSGDPNLDEKARDIFARMKQWFPVPDRFAYTTMIHTLASAKRNPNAAANAMELLEEMQDAHGADSSSYINSKEDIVAYTNVMMALGKHRHYGGRGSIEKLLQLAQFVEEQCQRNPNSSITPDAAMYGVVISAVANSGFPDAGTKSLTYLRKLDQLEQDTGCSFLNVIHYSNVMVAWWKSGAKEATYQVEKLLEEMKDRAAEGNIEVAPDTRAYTTVIQCWAKSRSSSKAVRAMELLKEMTTEYQNGNVNVQPNVFTYTAVLNAAAYVRGDDAVHEEALRIALEALVDFRSQPNYESSTIMYITLLRVFRNNVKHDKERMRYSNMCIQQCCNDGHVNDSFLKALQDMEPALYDKLPRDEFNTLSLPKEWTMNVRQY